MQRCCLQIGGAPLPSLYSSIRRMFIPRPHPYRAWPRRQPFTTDALFAILTPPAVFSGLLVSLWTYKCIMMVVFQNKIVYMPSVPPFSRSEKVEDYAIQCRPVAWQTHAIKSLDGTRIKLLEGTIKTSENPDGRKHVVVLYFQGNASSLPPRLPYLSRILKAAAQQSHVKQIPVQYTLVALSYRGFWTSSGRPSQPGIELDTAAALDWTLNKFSDPNTKFILWGQSIGAGAASVALANFLNAPQRHPKMGHVSGLLLETPFVNLRAMLIALYPQKFLPYRYLAPFLRSTWDSQAALQAIADVKTELKVLILQAGDDEIVPADNAPALEHLCRARGMEVERVVIDGALHTEVMAKPQGRKSIMQFIETFGD